MSHPLLEMELGDTVVDPLNYQPQVSFPSSIELLLRVSVLLSGSEAYDPAV